tara:strand:+ start:47 stop:616 length:570 start_codon:yes stop_codon:yes gene_type:complete
MRNRKKQNKEEHEFYPTPIDAVELARTLLDQNKRWWEPCAGDGRILNHFDNVILGTDIKPRSPEVKESNFITMNKPKNIEGIITNPPFTLGYDLIKKALYEWKIPALLLMRVEYIAAKARQDVVKHMTDMHIVSDLIKFETISGRIVNGNGTGRCAWMLFDPNKTPEYIRMKYVLYKKKINKSNLNEFF